MGIIVLSRKMHINQYTIKVSELFLGESTDIITDELKHALKYNYHITK